MEPIEDSQIERVLVVTAHPDDCDFGAAGTIALWTAKGIKVSYCICTNGDCCEYIEDEFPFLHE